MIYNYLPGYIRGKNGWKRPKQESFSSWAQHLGPAVLKEMHRRGIDSYVVYDSVMRQAGYETQYSGTLNAPHNYTNIKAVGSQPRHGVYRDFASDADWAKAYFDNIQSRWPNALKAKSIYDYVMDIHPAKGYRYSETPRNQYYHNMAGVVSGSKAALQYWNDRKKLWKAWDEAAAPVDNTNVAKPVMEIPVPVEQHQQQQPTTYIDPTLLLEQPEETQQPVVEDNYEASLLPSIQDAMQYFLPSQTPFANNDFMSQLVQIGLPGAKYGKDSGIHIKPSHRGRFTQYLKSHPGMTAEKAKHSKSAAVRKMATFALNARKWNH